MPATVPVPVPDVVASVETPHEHEHVPAATVLTPPTSEENDRREERLSSELTDIDSDDGEDIEPDHYFEGGKVPVFKPVGGGASSKHVCSVVVMR